MAYIKSRKHRLPAIAAQPLAAVTLLAGLAVTAPAAASDDTAADAQSKAKSLMPVTVEATRGSDYVADRVDSPKFTQPLLDTTQTISVITKDLFLQQGATTLTEALRNTPGVGTFYAGENGTTTTGDGIYMRGFDTSSSIFVDGVRDTGSISRDIFNIEQVEVTKGPAGTDYGRTAPTGAINLVTKQPQLRNALSGQIAYGTADRKRATADWNQVLGATSAFRLNVMAQNAGVPGRDEVENNRWGFAPSLAFGLGTPTRVYLDYLHIKQNNVPDGGVSNIGLPGYSSPDPARPWLANARPVDPTNFYGTDADRDHVTSDLLTLRLEHDINEDTALHNTLRWGRTHQDYLLTSFMATAANLRTPDPNDPSTWTVARSNPTFKNQTNKILTDQLNLTADFRTGGIEHNLSTGVELTREEADTTGIVPVIGSSWPAAGIYRPDPHVTGLRWYRNGSYSHGKTDTASAYAFDTLKFDEQWQINAGVRLDRYRTDFHSAVTCGSRNTPACGSLPANSAVPGVDARKRGNLANWKVGVLYKPAANGSVYANYAVSQQPPGGGTLALSNATNSADNPNFDPQKARTAEVGTKWEFDDSRLMLTGAVYRTEVSNDVVQDPVDLQYYQTGKKRVQGVELSAVGKLSEHWAISAGYTVMDTKVIRGSKVTSDGSSDLAYTPKSAFTAWTTYTLPFGLTIGGGARYNGQLKRGTDGAIGTPAYTDAYWVFDAVATYPINRHLDLQLNVYNLFDKDYVAAINKSGYRYTPGTPRSAMLTANVRF